LKHVLCPTGKKTNEKSVEIKPDAIRKLSTSSFVKSCIQQAGFSEVKNETKTEMAAISYLRSRRKWTNW
jgi:hypothetical protein